MLQFNTLEQRSMTTGKLMDRGHKKVFSHCLPEVGDSSRAHEDAAEKQETNDHDSSYTFILVLYSPLYHATRYLSS